MSERKRIVIIGAGSSGLTAIKTCLEDQLEPVCLEKTLDIGGLWNYSPHPSAPGTAGIYDSLVINTCKEMTSFSDFPVPSHFPQFLSHTHVLSYFRQYARHFNLLPHIRFNTEMRHIRRADDYDPSGKWTVTYVEHAYHACPMKCTNFGRWCQQDKTESDDRFDTDTQKSNDGDRDRTSDQSRVKEQGQSKERDSGKYSDKVKDDTKHHDKTKERDKTNQHETAEEQKDMKCHDKETDEPDKGMIIPGKEKNDELKDPDVAKEQDKDRQQHKGRYQDKASISDKEKDQESVKEEDITNNQDKAKDKTGNQETAEFAETHESNSSNQPLPEVSDDAAPEAEMQGRAACREVTEDYDGVMICTGHHTVPYVPHIPGREQFQGRILHSQDYKRPEAFRGQCVLIVGIGNSAVDIASDLAKAARQVYLSTRRGSWIISRSVMSGIPADMIANSRVMSNLPSPLLQWTVEKQANLRMDHERLGLTPRHRVLGAHPTINDELPFHLLTQRVQVRADVSTLLSDAVQFCDGSVEQVDVIIMATGYDYRLDFVDSEVIKVKENRVKLYKYVFPPDLPHPTLAVIGLVQAIGAVMPIAELQSRWFVSLCLGRVRLPNLEEMERDIAQREREMDARYYQSRRHTLQTFWVQYMDEIAVHIGAKPDLWRLLLKDPALALRCFLGPCLPAQYRLQGPHPWPYAAHFIRSVWTRYATRPRSTRDPHKITLPSAHTPSDDIELPATEGESSGPAHATTAANSSSSSSSSHDDDNNSSYTDASDRKSPEPSHQPIFFRRAKEDKKCGGMRVWQGWRSGACFLYVMIFVLCCLLWFASHVCWGTEDEVSPLE